MSPRFLCHVLKAAGLALTLLASLGLARADTLDLGSWDGSTYGPSGVTRGYWFQAPVDFTIDGLYLPSAGGAGTTFEILQLDVAPPEWPAASPDFTSLGFWTTDQNSVSGLNVAISAGSLVGILGYNGGQGTPYGDTYSSELGGSPVTLTRLVFQDVGPATAIASEASYPIGFVGMNYSVAPVPEPETWLMLIGGLALLGGVARRRRQSAALPT